MPVQAPHVFLAGTDELLCKPHLCGARRGAGGARKGGLLVGKHDNDAHAAADGAVAADEEHEQQAEDAGGAPHEEDEPGQAADLGGLRAQLRAREGEVEQDAAKGEEEQDDARVGADLASARDLRVLRLDGGARRRRRRDEDVVHEEERHDDDADDGEGEQQPVAPVPDDLDEYVDEEPQQRGGVDEEGEEGASGREAARADGHLDDALEALWPREGGGVAAEAGAAVAARAHRLHAVAALACVDDARAAHL
eukprot:scaffold4029_cov62-Phaeocystis_antarctica.AAC.1